MLPSSLLLCRQIFDVNRRGRSLSQLLLHCYCKSALFSVPDLCIVCCIDTNEGWIQASGKARTDVVLEIRGMEKSNRAESIIDSNGHGSIREIKHKRTVKKQALTATMRTITSSRHSLSLAPLHCRSGGQRFSASRFSTLSCAPLKPGALSASCFAEHTG